MFTSFLGSDTQMVVIVTARFPSYGSSWVAKKASSPFRFVATIFNPLGSAPRMTSAPAGGLASQLISDGWAGPIKTVGVVTPHVARHGSTSQSFGTSMPTPWYVTVFHPVGSGEDVEVVEVGAVVEVVAPEHAAKPAPTRAAAPTNIHRIEYFDARSPCLVPCRPAARAIQSVRSKTALTVEACPLGSRVSRSNLVLIEPSAISRGDCP